MLKPALSFAVATAVLAPAVSALSQDLAAHRIAYDVKVLDQGKPSAEARGTYAFELRATCDNYIMIQRLRIEAQGPKGPLVTEQQSQMTESRDGRKLQFDHKSLVNGKVAAQWKGEAAIDDDGRGQARYAEPAGQTVVLPAGTLFPAAIARATIQHAKAGDTGFDTLFSMARR